MSVEVIWYFPFELADNLPADEETEYAFLVTPDQIDLELWHLRKSLLYQMIEEVKEILLMKRFKEPSPPRVLCGRVENSDCLKIRFGLSGSTLDL